MDKKDIVNIVAIVSLSSFLLGVVTGRKHLVIIEEQLISK